MTNTPDREAIRRRARAMAIRLGYAQPEAPASEETPKETALPTDNVHALRGFLVTGRLTPAQEVVARRKIAATRPPAIHFPEDAA